MTRLTKWSPALGVVALTVMAAACSGRVESDSSLAEGLSFATDSNGWCFPCAMSIVTTDGDTITVDSTAGVGAIISAGREVAYNGLDGAGGYENEGQSLRVVNVGTGERRVVMREYTQVREIREVPLPSGDALLVVRMEDGGAGMSHIAIVDPSRGQLYRAPRSLVASIEGDTLELHSWNGEAPWTEPNGRDPATGLLRAPPASVQRVSLSAIMSGPVIENPHSGR